MTGVATELRLSPLVPIYEASGQSKAGALAGAALAGSNAFSGADNTEVVTGSSKVVCFSSSYRDARDDSNDISALTGLGIRPNDAICDGLEEFLSLVYLPETKTANM